MDISEYLFQVSGLRFQVSGSRFQVSGSRFQVSGFRFQVPGSRFQVPGSRFQVPGSRFQVSGFRFQVEQRRGIHWFRKSLGEPLCLGASYITILWNFIHLHLLNPLSRFPQGGLGWGC